MATLYDVIDYLFVLDSQHEGNGMSNLKVQKMLYYSQACTLSLENTLLFNKPIEAWQHGPVVADAYHLLKAQGAVAISLATWQQIYPTANSEQLSASDKHCIQQAFNQYGHYEAWWLQEETHKETPWVVTYRQGENQVISVNAIRDYFKPIFTQSADCRLYDVIKNEINKADSKAAIKSYADAYQGVEHLIA